MYSLQEIQAVWQDTNNPAVLRQFIGNAEMGWKVAWSDRMVAMYTSILLFGFLFGLFRQRIRPLPLWAFVLLLVPMFLDGMTHLISDMAGIGQGFRDSNTWLVRLTNHTLLDSFYAGESWGSFNSWMRLITSLLFGLGVVWITYPRLQSAFVETSQQIEAKIQKGRQE